MHKGYAKVKILYPQDEIPLRSYKISSVIYSWQQGQRLIPPTILIYNKEFAETLENSNFESTEDLRPQDGKHRINAAYCLGATNIPILVRNRQLDLIKKILFS